VGAYRLVRAFELLRAQVLARESRVARESRLVEAYGLVGAQRLVTPFFEQAAISAATPLPQLDDSESCLCIHVDRKNLYRFCSHTFPSGGGNHWWEISFPGDSCFWKALLPTCSQGRDGLKNMLPRPQRSQGTRGRGSAGRTPPTASRTCSQGHNDPKAPVGVGALALRPLRPQEFYDPNEAPIGQGCRTIVHITRWYAEI
jgi:hypothetical protein